VAVTIAAIAVTILSIKAINSLYDTHQVLDRASRSLDKLDRSTTDLDPAIRELRRAGLSLQQLRNQTAGSLP